jgi:hypothetical protein
LARAEADGGAVSACRQTRWIRGYGDGGAGCTERRGDCKPGWNVGIAIRHGFSEVDAICGTGYGDTTGVVLAPEGVTVTVPEYVPTGRLPGVAYTLMVPGVTVCDVLADSQFWAEKNEVV